MTDNNKRPSVAVVIPNRDGAEFLGRCLDTILRLTPPASEVIRVDDGSRDNSVAMVARDYPGVTLIRSTGERVAPEDAAAKGEPRGFAYESIRTFVDRMLDGRDFPLTLTDAARTSLAILAIMESARIRQPVEVNYG